MIALAFDTSLDVCSVALMDTSTHSILAERHVVMTRGHAEALHGLIGEAMAEANIRFSEIGRILVTTGPGTFTGSRIGIAAARGFALTLHVPVTGISTLQALAANVTDSEDRSILSAVDARRGQIYAALYSPDLTELVAPIGVNVEAVAGLLPDEPIIGIGTGTELISPIHHPIRLSGAERLPRAAIWGLKMLEAPIDDKLPSPLYLRAPDAKPPSAGSIVTRKQES